MILPQFYIDDLIKSAITEDINYIDVATDYLLDENHDCTLVREEIFTAKEFASYLKLGLYSSYLIKIKAV